MRTTGTAEFDLHGVVGVHVVNARPDELNAIRRQLGPIERSLHGRAPDIVIRFVDRIERNGTLRHITRGFSAFDERRYYVLRDDEGRPTRTTLPMDAVGAECEVVCPRGTRGVRALLDVINLTALWKGLVPVHGSAFVHHGRGVLVVGWAKGGKTETLLAFREHGADYVGDEWIYVDPDGQRMYGIPEPIRLWEWHFRSSRSLRSVISPFGWWRLRTAGAVAALADRLAAAASRNSRPVARVARKAAPSLHRQLSLRIPPERLFIDPPRSGVLAERLIWAVSHAANQIIVEPVDASVVAARMASSVEYELRGLAQHYQQFRYAFPGSVNPRIEGMSERLHDMLGAALSPVEAYRVVHPYPVDLALLYAAVAPATSHQARGNRA